MSFFKPKTLNGKRYDISHLDPFQFTLNVDEFKFNVEVEFSCHCFTTKLTSAHSPDFSYSYREETRAFDLERHQLSFQLPDLFQKMGNRSVYWSNKGNFFFWKSATNAPYLVYFDVIRSSKSNIDVRIDVRTAHLKPNMTLWASPIKFTTLIEAKSNGKKLKAGPAQQIKRK